MVQREQNRRRWGCRPCRWGRGCRGRGISRRRWSHRCQQLRECAPQISIAPAEWSARGSGCRGRCGRRMERRSSPRSSRWCSSLVSILISISTTLLCFYNILVVVVKSNSTAPSTARPAEHASSPPSNPSVKPAYKPRNLLRPAGGNLPVAVGE